MKVDFERLHWENYPSTDTPINADNLNRLEEGVAGLYSDMTGIEEGIDSFKDETSAQVGAMQTRLTTMEGDIDSFEEITLGQVGSMQTRVTSMETKVTSMENGLPTMVGEQIDTKFGDDIGDNVTAWLTEHVTPSGSAVVVDDTLTIQGAAADAKKTGDEISAVNDGLTAVESDVTDLKEDFGDVISDTMDVSVSGSYVDFEPFFGKKLFGSGCMFSGSGATYDIDISDLDLVGKTISVFMWLDDMTSFIEGNITEVQLDANNQQIYPSSGYHYVGHPMEILSNCKKIRLYASQNAYSSWSSSTIQHIQLSESGSAQVECIQSYSVRGMASEEDLNKLEDNVIGYNPHYSYTVVKDEYVKTNGAIESYPTWDRTDYIPLVGTVLYVTIEYSGNPYNCLYDANKNFISNFQTVTAGTATIELPPSAKYVVLSAGAGEKWVLTANMPDSLTELDTRVSNLEAQTIINGWSGKKWVSYGDSITQGNTWQPIVASKFGLVHINKGVGGSSVADGQINGVVSMCNAERIAELPSDADIITIMGGTNDYNLTNEGKGTPLGDFPISSASYDTFTFYGAYLAMLQRIQQQCPNALIVVMSCINSRGVTGQNETYCYQNQLGLSTPDYSSAAEAVARYTGSAFLDMEKCGITLFNRAKYITDTVHPNAEGGKLMARMVISYLQTHQPN